MELDAATSAKVAELRTQLESLSGHPINASDQQLLKLTFPGTLSTHDDNATLLSRSIIFPGGKSCQGNVSILDVSGSSSTDGSGRSAFLLTDNICDLVNSFDEPVCLVVTPNSQTPCYATMTHTLVQAPNPPRFADLQIVVNTWDANGQPAPGISFDWRCRLINLVPIG